MLKQALRRTAPAKTTTEAPITMLTSNDKQMTILLADDDEADILFFKRLCKKNHVECDLQIARDGDDALDLLNTSGPPARPALPDLIFTDLNMPRMSGFELVKAIRSDPRLKDIPIFVVSTSDRSEDLELARRSGADGYFVKPLCALDLLSALGERRAPVDARLGSGSAVPPR